MGDDGHVWAAPRLGEGDDVALLEGDDGATGIRLGEDRPTGEAAAAQLALTDEDVDLFDGHLEVGLDGLLDLGAVGARKDLEDVLVGFGEAGGLFREDRAADDFRSGLIG